MEQLTIGSKKSQYGKLKRRDIFTCEQCGDTELMPPARAEERRFCSTDCTNKWRRGRRRVEYVELKCQHCGSEFEIPPAWERDGRRKFCSRDCKNSAQKGITGEEHPRYGCTHSEESKRKMSENVPDLNPPEYARWNGGRFVDGAGYVHLHKYHLDEEEMGLAEGMLKTTGYVLEHRIVMAKKLDRPLEDGEVVHHVNGDKQDNRIENLAIMDRSEHSAKHRQVDRKLTKLKAENRKLRKLLSDRLNDGETVEGLIE